MAWQISIVAVARKQNSKIRSSFKTKINRKCSLWEFEQSYTVHRIALFVYFLLVLVVHAHTQTQTHTHTDTHTHMHTDVLELVSFCLLLVSLVHCVVVVSYQKQYFVISAADSQTI